MNKTNSYFILWTGGLDSTFLVNDLLEKGNKVTTAYIEILNNSNKTKREINAQSQLSKYFSKQYPSHFKNLGTIIKYEHLTETFPLPQLPIILSTIITHSKSEYVSIGYCMGDTAISVINEITTIYNQYKNLASKLNHNMPEIYFPLQYIPKSTMANKLSNLNLLHLTTSCENPDDDNCNQCKPCIIRKYYTSYKNNNLELT